MISWAGYAAIVGVGMGSGPDETGKLRLERDLFLRLLELGSREDLRPFLADALALIVEVAGARKGYLELHGSFWIAQGLPDAELADVRREISTGIIAEALGTGRTVNTASAVDDPRFAGQASVQAQRIRAVLCAPVGIAPAIGVLYLQGRGAPGPLPPGVARDARSLSTSVHHAAVAGESIAKPQRQRQHLPARWHRRQHLIDQVH